MHPLEPRDCPALWISTGDTNFNNPLNWDTGEVPGTGLDPVAQFDGTSSVDCNGPGGLIQIYVDAGYGGTITLGVTTDSTNLNMESGTVIAPSAAVLGDFDVNGGTFEAQSSLSANYINMFGPSGSSVTVQGAASIIDSVGLSGGGSVNLVGGGTVGGVDVEAGALTVGAPLTGNWLDLTGGKIDQAEGADITVAGEYGDFYWTGGSINEAGNAADLIITGATTVASIAPLNAGTVTTGSNLTLENGAEATLGAGTINVTNSGVQFTTSTGSRLLVNPGSLGETIVRAVLQPAVPPLGVILPGTSWTVYAGTFLFDGAIGNGGTVTLMPEVIVSLAGDPVTNEGYVQWGGAATYLYGDSNLVSLNEPVLIQGGTLATVWADSVSSGSAAIVSPTVEVSGGDIYVCQQQGAHVNFSAFFVDGNVEWSGGTFHPYVYADGETRDYWRAVTSHYAGTFTITGGTIAPIYLDSDYGTSSFPYSGDEWKVLMADGGFTNMTAPAVDNGTVWMMQIDPMSKYWNLVAR